MSEENQQELTRTEKDLIGTIEIKKDSLTGIYTARAIENFFLLNKPSDENLITAYGAVKLAALRTNHKLGWWEPDKFAAMEQATLEIMNGEWADSFPADALQGGAGTSLNMNLNEVIANRALQILNLKPGQYNIIHPLNDINLHQSTNDTYPTALKIAAIRLFNRLEIYLTELFNSLQSKAEEFSGLIKIGRTQMQDAVLTTLGREFSAWADAIARDRWRVYKCEERLRVVNLGGTAIGTGISAPREYIFKVTDELRNITGLNISRAENLIDATQNVDALVEVSGILKALASTLQKICHDLRFLSSGPSGGIGEINLPPRQAGSSIMPDKINPVIPEAVIQASIMVAANDSAVFQAASAGNLELNPFLPLIAHCLLQNLQLMINATGILRRYCIDGITANQEKCRQNAENSTAAVTSLVEYIGYEKAQTIAVIARNEKISIRQAVLKSGLMDEESFNQAISPEAVTRLGYPLRRKRKK